MSDGYCPDNSKALNFKIKNPDLGHFYASSVLIFNVIFHTTSIWKFIWNSFSLVQYSPWTILEEMNPFLKIYYFLKPDDILLFSLISPQYIENKSQITLKFWARVIFETKPKWNDETILSLPSIIFLFHMLSVSILLTIHLLIIIQFSNFCHITYGLYLQRNLVKILPHITLILFEREKERVCAYM